MSFSPLYPVTEIEMRLVLDGTFRYISDKSGCYETRDVAEDYIPSYSAVARQDRHDRADGYYASVQAAASNPTFWTSERIAHIAGLRAKGYSFADIAAPLGKTEKAVRLAYDNHLRRIRGRPLEAKTPWKPADDEKLFAMKDAGHTWNEIAMALGRRDEPCQTRWSKLRARAALAPKGVLTQSMRHKAPDGDCPYCDRERAAGNDFHPSHDASRSCKSGGHSHCSCDTCF